MTEQVIRHVELDSLHAVRDPEHVAVTVTHDDAGLPVRRRPRQQPRRPAAADRAASSPVRHPSPEDPARREPLQQ
ncbi:hypothetical protein OHU45_21495 [Streptomyces tubercidicus]|uniref:hypothetical protein n=1 Tax=Streptomyces tubercidicus TaxID=47759 RepID=UPI0030E35AA3